MECKNAMLLPEMCLTCFCTMDFFPNYLRAFSHKAATSFSLANQTKKNYLECIKVLQIYAGNMDNKKGNFIMLDGCANQGFNQNQSIIQIRAWSLLV